MKHTIDDLLHIVYRYYPRGVGIVDGDLDMQAINDSEEHARLVAARIQAAKDERWPAMRRRIEERFPDAPLMNDSLHLPTGRHDACYSFNISLPGATNDRTLWFQVSFLAPYYIIHKACTTDIEKEPRTDFFLVTFQEMSFHVLRSLLDRELISSLGDERLKPVTITRRHVTFDLLPDERPYAEWIAREIETTFGCERMPPEVGTVLVPDLATPKLPGEVRLYDCLFTNDDWVKPSPSDVPAPAVRIDASSLTEPFIAVLTVLAALNRVALTLTIEARRAEREGGFAIHWVVKTDGMLHKGEVLCVLAMIRSLMDSPLTPRGIAARREFETATPEFEALAAAWDGDGAPPCAMVAWASRLLANWPTLLN